MLGRMSAPDPTFSSLDGLQMLIGNASELLDQLLRDPILLRLLRAFFALPESDREPILRVLERDATWRRIVQETVESTGIAVRPNPHASLYVHVFDEVTRQPIEPEPLARDVDAIRLGIERFVHLLPLFFQEGVHEQWTRSARELIRRADPELRGYGVRLAEDVLGLIREVSAGARDER